MAATVALLFPLGVPLGLFFPTGMRLARAAGLRYLLTLPFVIGLSRDARRQEAAEGG